MAGNGLLDVAEDSSLVLNSSVIHNGAEIKVNDNSQITFDGAVSGGGDYTGSGKVQFNDVVDLGNGTDLINIEGDMGLGEDSQTFMEIAGIEIGTGYDAFDIGGTLWLDGLLDISFSSDFFTNNLLDNSFSFDLFSAETITGEFDLSNFDNLSARFDWVIKYMLDDSGTDYVTLNLTKALQTGGGGGLDPSAVPEPTTALLFGAGLAGLVGVRLRRNKK